MLKTVSPLKLAVTFLLDLSAVGAIASIAAPASAAAPAFGSFEVSKVLIMPSADGHADWVQAINAAQSSIHMTMYHLTDSAVIDALKKRAAEKTLDIRIIVDGKSSTGGYAKAMQEMTAAGVEIRGSSPAFSITHSKDMVIDHKTAFIGAINLTNTFLTNRDFAIITPDETAINEIETVFESDWANTQSTTRVTPPTTDENLVWSPTNSDPQLIKLIASAQSSVVLESENFNNTDVINALNAAAARGVAVRVVLPECAQGNAGLNYAGIAQLKGIDVHMEHDGGSIAQPYMHSKMIVVDDLTVYVGSINFSFNSILNDRELGAIFSDATTAATLASEFEKDWSRSVPPVTNYNCPAQDFGPAAAPYSK